MRGLALMGTLWAGTMLAVWAAGLWTEATAAFGILAAAVLVFAIGECLHGAIQAPLSVDLAPPQLVGRYVAAAQSGEEVTDSGARWHRVLAIPSKETAVEGNGGLRIGLAAIIAQPKAKVAEVNSFLGGRLDVDSAIRAIEPNLYRNRSAGAATA